MSIDVMVPVWKHGPTQPHLRLLMLALADNASAQGHCWPSVDTLAAKCAVEPRTLQRNLRTLETEGWITTTQRPGRSTSYQIDLTRLTPDAGVTPDARVTPDASVTPAPDAGVTPTPDVGVTPPLTPTSPEPSENHQGNRQGEPSAARVASLAVAAAFDAFWMEYPRKVGKGAAKVAWMKAVKKVGGDTQRLIAAAAQHAQHHQARRTEARYIANPATWLNQERWDDVLPEVTSRETASAAESERIAADLTGFGDHWRSGGGF